MFHIKTFIKKYVFFTNYIWSSSGTKFLSEILQHNCYFYFVILSRPPRPLLHYKQIKIIHKYFIFERFETAEKRKNIKRSINPGVEIGVTKRQNNGHPDTFLCTYSDGASSYIRSALARRCSNTRRRPLKRKTIAKY